MLEFVFFAWLCGALNEAIAQGVWSAVRDQGSAAIVVGAITLFLASGAVGYVAANFYHAIMNSCLRSFDYSRELRSLASSNCLRVCRLDGTAISLDQPDYRRDWVIVTAIWHERRDTNQQIKAATERAQSLIDIAHGTGTLLVGSAIAWLVAMLWGVVSNWPSCRLLLGLVGLVPIVLHWISFRWTASVARSYVGTIFANQIRYDSGRDSQPVLVYYAGE
jgi:hypothetical protein